MKNQNQLKTNLGINFQNPHLLNQAMVHRSYLNEVKKNDLESNERLEFLGDAVLEFVISAWLFDQFPNRLEGDLTNLRSGLVKTESLAKIGRKLKIGDYLVLGKGEKGAGGQRNTHLLANGLEAIIGAIFLDQGLAVTEKFIKTHFQFLFNELIQSGKLKDYKSLFQEKVQAKTKKAPIYKVIKEEGPDHAKTFVVTASLGKKLIAIGQGKTKQAAQQKAAKIALEKLGSKR